MPASSRSVTAVPLSPGDDSDTSGTSAERDTVVTRGQLRKEIEDASERQARGIRYEFQQQRQWTDARFEEQRQRTDAKFERVQQELREQRQWTDAKFEEQRQWTDAKFEEQRQRTDILYNGLKAQAENRGATHLWNRIRVIVIHEESSGKILEPKQFPGRVGDFWRLKQRRGWKELAYLHEFYGSTSWPDWGLQSFGLDSDEESEQLVPAHKSLGEAVEYAPEVALQELAQHLGLDYDKISMNVEDDLQRQRNRSTREKRSHIPEDLKDLAKRPKADISTPAGRVDAAPERTRDNVGLTISQLVGGSPKQVTPPRPRTPSTTLGWAPPSDPSRAWNMSLSPTSVATSRKGSRA